MFVPATPSRQPRTSASTLPITGGLGSGSWHSSGSAAFVHCVRELGLAQGARILIPAFVCPAVRVAVRKAGLVAVHYDVGDDLRPGDLSAAAEALLHVRFFGVSGPLNRAARDLQVVEDGAHTLPHLWWGDAGSAGAPSFFSLRKLLPVPDGGLLLMGRSQRSLPFPPPTKLRRMSRIRSALRSMASRSNVNPLPVRDLFSRDDEQGEVTLAGISATTLAILAELDMTRVALARRRNYGLLASILVEAGVGVPIPEMLPGAVPQGLPLRHRHADAVVRILRRRGIEAYRWGRYPETVDPGAFPSAYAWSRESIVLPVQQDLPEETIRTVGRETIRAMAEASSGSTAVSGAVRS